MKAISVIILILFAMPVVQGIYIINATYSESWLQPFSGPDRTNHYDGDGPENNGTYLKVMLQGPSFGGFSGAPIIDNEFLYVSFSSWSSVAPNEVLCYSRDDGSLVWSLKMSAEETATNTPVIYGSSLIITTSKWKTLGSVTDTLRGTIMSLDKGTGKIQWSMSIDRNTISPPLVYGDKIFFYTGGYYYRDGGYYAYCLDAKTGDVLWISEIDSRAYGDIAAHDGIVFFPLRNGRIYAFSAEEHGSKPPQSKYPEGKLLWSKSIDMTIFSVPAVYDGKLFVTARNDGKIIALDAKTGGLVWQANTGMRVGSYVSAGCGILVSTYSETDQMGWYDVLTALNPDTGEMLWNHKLPEKYFFNHYAIIAKNLIYISTKNDTNYFIASFGHDGSAVWNETFNGTILYAGSMADGMLYSLGFSSKWLYVFDGSAPDADEKHGAGILDFGRYSFVFLAVILIILSILILYKKRPYPPFFSKRVVLQGKLRGILSGSLKIPLRMKKS